MRRFALTIAQQPLPRFGWLAWRPEQRLLLLGNLSSWIATALFVIASIALFVELGLRRGSPNRYGFDPLALGELRRIQSSG